MFAASIFPYIAPPSRCASTAGPGCPPHLVGGALENVLQLAQQQLEEFLAVLQQRHPQQAAGSAAGHASSSACG